MKKTVMNNMKPRVVFLDYLRVIAIFMVMLVHACEQYYFGADGGFYISSKWDAWWVVAIDSACRAAVPLFVMASAYLLFPIGNGGGWLRHRILRVGVPFAIWAAVYNWKFGGGWVDCLFNFPSATGGHLWFVPMLIGLYLLMPLLSPWAEKVEKRELRGWILLWLFTTTFPFLRKLCGNLCGAPSFGAIPYLYGECPWNGFGTFHYVSGFAGYMLLGLYLRRFAGDFSWLRTLKSAIPLLAIGWTIVAGGFYFRIANYGASFPVSAPYAAAVDLEMSWEFCSLGVVMTVIGYFAIIRKLTHDGWFYRRIVLPLSGASFGVYLVHILVLVAVVGWFKPAVTTPLAIFGVAITTFLISAAVSMLGRKIPKIGRWIFG